MERRLAVILAADVVGFTRLMAADEAGTLAVLKAYWEDFIAPTVAEHRGRIVKLMGDGMLAEFSSAVDGVSCAAELQRGLAARNAEVPLERRILARIGINLGDVVVEGRDLYGIGVNIAARLEGLAEAGGICLSAKVHDEVRNKLDLAFLDQGPQTMRNVPEPVRVYRVVPDWPIAAGGMPDQTALPLPDRPSIAVLPFANMSADPEHGFFCDGVTEDLITELARIPSLFVISRHSSFVYKEQARDIRRIGRDLGVAYLVEGSVRRSGERIRVTAQLIDAGDGGHAWAERYDRDVGDVFAVQDDVVRKIAAALGEQLSPNDPPGAAASPPTDLEAYEWLVRGRQNVFRAQGRQAASYALGKALELDPGLADAHAWLAIFHYSDRIFYRRQLSDETMAIAISAAETAIELAPESSLAHMSLGIVKLYGGEREPALRSLRRAYELNPNDADVLVFLQEAYTFEGEPERGIDSVRRAMRLNPHYPEWYLWHLGFALYAAQRYEEAIANLRLVLDIAEPSRILAASLAMTGRGDEARDLAKRFLATFPDFSIAEWAQTQPFKNPGDLEAFVEGYRLAGLPD
ncbi:MAG: adenylate/guanylate cyclase domain-containing protein [Alphaproteobacteria bacterium]|nr:adenylate/guanylate cyclase domain-containing protein [Alphaproteobacteria bacterium]